ncbi:hypothetical protein EDE15_3869 [Edaphobacter aggregans]|uniref:Uncharacterized protein n=1 Tax=Edaphobacter aggregans TaxID=570835 RepID=A0A3R9QCC3_9BACT|nr:hypothetical protein EDE15_3869 [Edaphobacter aggregans]
MAAGKGCNIPVDWVTSHSESTATAQFMLSTSPFQRRKAFANDLMRLKAEYFDRFTR